MRSDEGKDVDHGPVPTLVAFLEAEGMALERDGEPHENRTAVKAMVVRRLAGPPTGPDGTAYALTGTCLDGVRARLERRGVPWRDGDARTVEATFADLLVRFDEEHFLGWVHLRVLAFAGEAGLRTALAASEGALEPAFAPVLNEGTVLVVRDGEAGLDALLDILGDVAELAAAEVPEARRAEDGAHPELLLAMAEGNGVMAYAEMIGTAEGSPGRVPFHDMPVARMAARHALAHWAPMMADHADGEEDPEGSTIVVPIHAGTGSATLSATRGLKLAPAKRRVAAFLAATGGSPEMAAAVMAVGDVRHGKPAR